MKKEVFWWQPKIKIFTADRYYIAVDVLGHRINCSFDIDLEIGKRLMSLQKSDRVAFSGVFTMFFNADGLGGWIIDKCQLK